MDMPTESNQLLSDLITRLPELEWKISGLGASFSSRSLPRGLFANKEPSGASCIAEIKADIQSLSQQKNERSAFYLAERIRRKVNVLVALCQIHSRKNITEENVSFGVKMLSTRQQWIQGLETDIQTLERQQQALTTTLEQMTRSNHPVAVILQLKSELGEIERRLTLAKETWSRAIS
ncbi:primosomal replication protein PriC [Legionella drancourtii]|uniref:Coiled-coil protein n=1 Tax=Legionella drancourtii LLAP12 TaxID=658187 RepID=G9ET22_9GAMM|nr:primosomal replication protein PriC [Legionella drancourtii]EHL29489.1 hypothetical protein LDG_8451 [Legionella drancourtii LLAP12]